MTWQLSEDVHKFLAATGELLAGDLARASVLLTVSEGVRAGVWPDARFGWWTEGDMVTGAYLRTPPHPAVLGPMPQEAARGLAGVLRGTGLVGVRGADTVVSAFGGAWGPYEVERAERLFALTELVAPASVPGRARLAEAADLALLTSWLEAFLTEVGLPADPYIEALARRRVAAGQLVVWEVDGQGPVSLAATSDVLAAHARIGPVYTPPSRRGRGYAAGATAAATRLAQERGAAQVMLFADHANPTSNALYRKLGYRELEDHLSLRLSD
ncbi:GNAT family N-acetyltransferase [Streptomyces sp. NPDC002952]|uniref:GNAT family N-acetyltransferase n=1 Tax=Streptomyces sp. NPDC002952 TaxID=3364673 RepID=UPI0036A195AF